jgi:hypothetical protein
MYYFAIITGGVGALNCYSPRYAEYAEREQVGANVLEGPKTVRKWHVVHS